ncbi:MAG: isochorismate synthase [Phormidesmis sp. RL_2_1]|nr:isochorismate synthase [Phormidesmis sp. RL_2_1]
MQNLHGQLMVLNQAVSLGEAQLASDKAVTKDVAGFAKVVTAALAQIKAAQLHKVVLADVMDVVAAQAIDGVRSLQSLRHNHPDCTVFSVGNGRGQSFIGASPERLLSINEGQLTTDALAGSSSRGQTPSLDRSLGEALLHSDKERYEHQLVVEFIVQQLRSLGLTPHYTAAPRLLKLLHIQHLHTPISAVLAAGVVSPLDILAKLHPTPAVAGVPRQAACAVIRQHETFERGLYAAPLGWIDTQGNSEFIVGIRSALINGCKARLYAGAGIVAGSEPTQELAEIELKLQTLLNALV